MGRMDESDVARDSRGRWPRMVLLFVGLLLVAGTVAPTDAPRGMLGFAPGSAVRQREIEARYVAIPTPEGARAWHRTFTSEPHPAGSKRNNELAQYVADQWTAQGLEDVVVRRYDVLGSNPRQVQVEMVAPVAYVPTLREDPYKEDPDTAKPEVSGAWLSFSASGEVTAPVVYANSGNPADYDVLRQNGIDPRGKIVVVRYSNPYSYRGFKALTAEREGAAAMLVYSDPAEDGYTKGKVFPEGPWGPASHVQRGGIAYDYIVPGDPLTPGWASTPGAHRIPVEEAVSVPKIMAVALSYRDMQPILEKLGGPMAPQPWKGALPIEYHLGGEVAKLHVKVDMATEIQPYYVVEGRIRGGEQPDEWVVLGNHRDAWVFGGVDPSSGTAAMMEMTRALGQLKQQGIAPEADAGVLQLGRRGSHAHGLDRMGRAVRERAQAEGRRLPQRGLGGLGPQAVAERRGLPGPHDRGADEGARRPFGHVPLRGLAQAGDARARTGGRHPPRSGPRAPPRSAAARTTRSSSTTSACPSSRWTSTAPTASITPPTTPTTGSRTSAIPASSTTPSWPDSGGRWPCAWPTPTSCPSTSTPTAPPSATSSPASRTSRARPRIWTFRPSSRRRAVCARPRAAWVRASNRPWPRARCRATSWFA